MAADKNEMFFLGKLFCDFLLKNLALRSKKDYFRFTDD
jgi:hypothetical protein